MEPARASTSPSAKHHRPFKSLLHVKKTLWLHKPLVESSVVYFFKVYVTHYQWHANCQMGRKAHSWRRKSILHLDEVHWLFPSWIVGMLCLLDKEAAGGNKLIKIYEKCKNIFFHRQRDNYFILSTDEKIIQKFFFIIIIKIILSLKKTNFFKIIT